MDVNRHFWAGKRVCVTGGTGFLGWHLVRQLQDLTPHVRIFGLAPKSRALAAFLPSPPGTPGGEGPGVRGDSVPCKTNHPPQGTLDPLTPNPSPPEYRGRGEQNEQFHSLDCIFGDVRDPAAVRRAVHDCDIVFHTAGNVAVWGPGLAAMYEIHVEGTKNVVQAMAPHARVVHTSSVMAIGSSTGGAVLTEESPFNLQSFRVDYVHAKKNAEDVARNAAENGVDAVIVNPGYLIGPVDYENSVMGKFCLRFWKRKMPILPPGALNFVDVRDVARGHLLAAERGQRGRRYILGGENLTIRQFATKLAAVRDMPMRWRFSIPTWANTVLAALGECRGAILKREPYPAMQFARMSRHVWHFSSARAEAELGFRARPVAESLADAHAWLCAEGLLQLKAPGPKAMAA